MGKRLSSLFLVRIAGAYAVGGLAVAAEEANKLDASPALAAPQRPTVTAQPAPEAVAPAPSPSSPEAIPPEMLVEAIAPPVSGWLEAQIELARRGFSSGSIDGAVGTKTRAALRAFQLNQNLPPTGELDAATRAKLTLSALVYSEVSLTAEELAGFQPISDTWLGKSQQAALAYENALEAVAERFHAHPALIRQLNPGLDWATLTPGTSITVPGVERVTIIPRVERLQINLTDCVLEAFDVNNRPIAHFPVSIGRTAEKRPAGELHVANAAANPNFTFDPAVFPESPEARELGRKLILPPGPNNPVGVAWIGLDRPGYGIHGTPAPERVGRAESHGCFRLANWDARTLLSVVRLGLPVLVEP